METTFEIIGEILAFIILLITIFSLYGKVIKDYTNLKKDVAQLQKDYLDLSIEMRGDYEGLRIEINRLNEKRNKDYEVIMKQISSNHADMLGKNEKLFKEILKLIMDHDKQNSDSLVNIHNRINELSK